MNFVSRLRERVDNSLWLIPSALVIGGIGLSFVTTLLDEVSEGRPFSEFVFTGGPTSARAILQTVAAAVITFTGLVFTVTVVALQLSSQQFSPRVLRTFLRDRQSKFALGTFVGTFMFCLMVLRVVSDEDDRGITIPSISMMALLLLTLASVAMFVSFISHMSHAIRVSSIATAVGNETRQLISRLPESGDEPPEMDRSLLLQKTTQRVAAPRQGTLVAVNHEGLVALAAEMGAAFEMRRRVGDYLAEGQLVLEVKGGSVDQDTVSSCFQLGLERTMEQDVNFGLRQLVDVAERALSPSMNDPTTAVIVLDQIHDLLRRLAAKPFPPVDHPDGDGVVRLRVKPMDWEALVTLAFSEIRQFSSSSLQVVRRMLAALDDLEAVALPERKEALRTERRLLEKMISASFEDPHDQDLARQPDPQGIGSDN